MTESSRMLAALAEWEALQQQGSDPTPQQLCPEEPELWEPLAQEIEKQRRLQRLLYEAASTDASADAPGSRHDERLPTVDGYEVLGVLGRGGMGVVYKARHRRLNRLVALKAIAAGVLASPAERQRLWTEATALSRLRHPHIVQIHEVHDHGELLCLALELMEGGTLAQRLGHRPQPPREAAELVEQLARAVEVAHREQVIHRDLKPANVLLTADGAAKLGDFGLARKLDEAGQSHSGEAVGTPSYMAPEQATGRRAAVGPNVDVYGLGAILYEMLTGRPPFQGATRAETLKLVCEAEPVAPRQLLPAVPRDLETICLKCLHKEPARRYATADELAEELARFRSGLPILARPVGVSERALKWVKRRPLVSALVGVVLVVSLLGVAGVTAMHRLMLEERNEGRTQAMNATLAWEIAERERRNAADNRVQTRKKVADSLLTLTESPILKVKGMENRRKQMLLNARETALQLLEQDGADVRNQLLVAESLVWLARLRFELGEVKEATTDANRCIELCLQVPPGDPRFDHAQVLLSQGYGALGKILPDAEAKLSAQQKSLRCLEAVTNEYFQDRGYARAWTLVNLAIACHRVKRDKESLQHLDEAERIYLGLSPEDGHARRRLQHLLQVRGEIYTDSHDLERAAEAYARSRDVCAALVQASPKDLEMLHELACVENEIGKVRSMQLYFALRARTDPASKPKECRRFFAEAEKALLSARAAQEKLLGLEPHTVGFQSALGMTCSNLAMAYLLDDQPQRVLEPLGKARDIFKRLHLIDPDDDGNVHCLGSTCLNLGHVQRDAKNYRAALAQYEEVLPAVAKTAQKATASLADRRLYTQMLGDLGLTLADLDQPEKAQAALRQALDWGKRSNCPELPDYVLRLARLLRERGQPREAVATLRESLKLATVPTPLRYEAALEVERSLIRIEEAKTTQADRDFGITCLEQAIQGGFKDRARLQKDFTLLKTHPRWDAVLRQLQ